MPLHSRIGVLRKPRHLMWSRPMSARRCSSRGSAARPILATSSGRVSVLEGPVLGPSSLIEDEPASKTRSRPGKGSELGTPAEVRFCRGVRCKGHKECRCARHRFGL